MVPKADYLKIFGKLQKRIINRLLELVQSIPFFSEWKKKDVRKLAMCFTEIDYQRNNTVIKQNEESKFIYLVKEGDFDVYKLINFSP